MVFKRYKQQACTDCCREECTYAGGQRSTFVNISKERRAMDLTIEKNIERKNKEDYLCP
jgi:hypothetical protein